MYWYALHTVSHKPSKVLHQNLLFRLFEGKDLLVNHRLDLVHFNRAILSHASALRIHLALIFIEEKSHHLLKHHPTAD
jgi:hypothetical protein